MATFLEVDGGEDSRLHEHYLFSLALRGNHPVSHPAVDVDLALRQLRGGRITISIYLLI
jgi:hypothetical protein